MTDWPRVTIVLSAGMLAAFQIGKVPVSIPILQQDLGLSLVLAGWIVGALHVVRFVFGSIVGRITDRVGHRRIVLLSLLCIAAASAMGTLSRSGEMILGTRIVEGIGVLFILVANPALLIQLTSPKDRRFALGIGGTWLPVGTGLMILFSPLMLGPFGWQGVWAANAVLLLIFAGVFAQTIPPAPPAGRPVETGLAGVPRDRFWQGVRVTATSKGPIVLAAMAALSSAGALSVSSFLPTFLHDEQAFSVAQAGYLTGIVVVSGALGSFLGAAAVSRGASLWSVIAIANVGVAVACLAIFEPDVAFPLRYAMCAIYLIGIAAAFSVQYNVLPMVAATPALIATTEGLRLQGGGFGFLLGPLAVAGIVTRYSWQEVSWFVFGLAAGGVLLSLVVRSFERAASEAAR